MRGSSSLKNRGVYVSAKPVPSTNLQEKEFWEMGYVKSVLTECAGQDSKKNVAEKRKWSPQDAPNVAKFATMKKEI